MTKKKYFKKIISILLCIAIIGTSHFFDRGVMAAEYDQVVIKQNDLSKNTMINNPFTEDTVIFAATYLEELNSIKALWEYSEPISSDIFIRRDDAKEFELFTTTQDKYVDIPVENFHEYCDIRVVVTVDGGNKVKSEIVTLHKYGGSFETIKRDSDDDKLPDGYEVWDIGTDPQNSDSDGDGFSDGYEVIVLCTDPLSITKDEDTDGDGLLNSEEMINGTNPYLADSDFDGDLDSLDMDPSITNFKNKKSVKYDVKLVIGRFDKTYEYTNADNEACIIIINSLTNNVKYSKIGNTSQTYYYNDDSKIIAQVNDNSGHFSADTYAYKDNKIAFIGHEGVAYKFDYNEAGDLVETKVGNQVIANHEYINSSPIRTVYANDQIISYGYDDSYEHITEVNINGDVYYENNYDADGNLVSQNDVKNEVLYQYTYDDNNHLTDIKSDNGFEIKNSIDDYKRLTSYTYDGIVKNQSLEYHDNETITNLLNGEKIITPASEDNNIRSNILLNDEDDIIYIKEFIKEDNCLKVKSNDGIVQVYEFDKNGNVIKIFEGEKEVSSYKYDSNNRLIRSNRSIINETILYEYDNNDNLVIEKHYKYTKTDKLPTALITHNNYEYDDDNWKDLLTSYNGQEITYDEIGNPLQYLDGMKFLWDSGRQLSKINTNEDDVTYSYNSDGLRTQKIVNGEITNFLLDGTKIIAEETKENSIWYSYDSNDYVVGFEYNNQKYYYGKNIQNDVTSIYNNNGDTLVEYLYDDWGNIVSISGNQELGKLNKFRYRSYYYDNESGLYYLQSRYYDSETGRFLNADEKLVTYNAFAYCENNPINYADYSGKEATFIMIGLMFIGFVALALLFVATNYFTLWREYFSSNISQLVGALASLGSYITIAIQQSVWNIANDVSIYIADKIRAYTQAPSFNSEYQVHHIVAERAVAAEPARAIFKKDDVKLDINDYKNLVPIKTGVHVHLHSSLYYAMVNTYIINAYYAGPISTRRYNVWMALDEIRVFLYALSNGAPF